MCRHIDLIEECIMVEDTLNRDYIIISIHPMYLHTVMGIAIYASLYTMASGLLLYKTLAYVYTPKDTVH